MDAEQFENVLRQWKSGRRTLLSAGISTLTAIAGSGQGGAKKKHKKKRRKAPALPGCEALPDVTTCTGTCGPVVGNCGQRVECPCPAGQCCASSGVCGACLVFVSQSLTDAELGGLAGADAWCQNEALGAGLRGTYLAWLSDATGSPSTRFKRATAPYTLVDGTVVASNWGDLTDANLAHPIKLTQSGAPGYLRAWSNTSTSGGPRFTDPANTCSNWTTPGTSGTFSGWLGDTQVTSNDWTSSGQSTCAFPQPLYCFQQPYA